MTTNHRTIIVGRCPHGCADVYHAEFEVDDRVIPVETIQAAIDDLTREPIYQETLTKALADRLGCLVVTKGVHGRFNTTCTAGE